MGTIFLKSSSPPRRSGRARPHSTPRAMPSSASVAVGVRLFTRMPWRARSMAAARVKFSRPLLLVQYAMFPAWPWCPAVDTITMMLPRRLSSTIRRATCLVQRNVPVRLTVI
jgi:hypothetical protein